jgi:hypothetical protein
MAMVTIAMSAMLPRVRGEAAMVAMARRREPEMGGV